ncbi:hypothetical protein SEA_LABELLE_65 [Mycobacterium phage Labelle]|nr:hypothetical protein SEA_LABELLE_65 [Mycobacterium phage Labelle]
MKKLWNFVCGLVAYRGPKCPSCGEPMYVCLDKSALCPPMTRPDDWKDLG